MNRSILAVALALTATSAQAADLFKPADIAKPIVEAVAPAPAGFKTGCYAEGSAGLGIDTYDVNDAGASVSFSDKGTVAGFGIGCDYSVGGGLFIGALAGIDWSNASLKFGDETTATKVSNRPGYHILAKVGFTPVSHLMVYGLAGASWSKYKGSITDIEAETTETDSEMFKGWMVGAGADFLLNEHLTVGARYTADINEAKGDIEPTNHVVRAVIGWRF